MKYFYPAVCKEETNQNKFFVYFPDMTECRASGHSMDEACNRAREALAASLLEIEEQGLPLPPATDEKDLRSRYREECVCTFLVDLDDYRRYKDYKIRHADEKSAEWRSSARTGKGRSFFARLFGTR